MLIFVETASHFKSIILSTRYIYLRALTRACLAEGSSKFRQLIATLIPMYLRGRVRIVNCKFSIAFHRPVYVSPSLRNLYSLLIFSTLWPITLICDWPKICLPIANRFFLKVSLSKSVQFVGTVDDRGGENFDRERISAFCGVAE